MQPKFENVDLNALAQEIQQHISMDSAFDPQKIHLSIEEGNNEVIGSVDSHLIKSVLLNLVLNAAQAMPDGGDIHITTTKNEKEALIHVIDTGIGIPKENLEKIFSPFFTTKSQGSGFGLAEVHRIINAHAGTIEVMSEVGKGSQFLIKLPLGVLHD